MGRLTMKEYNTTYYEAHQTRMAFSMPNMFRTEQEAREAIAEARIKDVENGYRPTDYIILKITVYTIYDDNGAFVSDTTHRERI